MAVFARSQVWSSIAAVIGFRSGALPQICGLTGAVVGGGLAILVLPHLEEPLRSVEPELRAFEPRTYPTCEHDHDDVQEHGREGRDGKTPMRVQHAACERRQRHEQYVREREPQHVGRQRESGVFARETGVQLGRESVRGVLKKTR